MRPRPPRIGRAERVRHPLDLPEHLSLGPLIPGERLALLKGPRSQVVEHLRRLDQPFSVCYEASCGYGHLY
jgi:hypothetical protein